MAQREMTCQETLAIQREVQNAVRPYFDLMSRVAMQAPASFILVGDKVAPEPMPEPFAGRIEQLRVLAEMEVQRIEKRYRCGLGAS